MILSHADRTFLYRRQLLVVGVAFCALIAPLFPAEGSLQRVVAPLIVILIAAIAYGFMLLALSLFERIFPRVAFYYCLLFYYVGLFGAFLIPLLWWYGVSHPDPTGAEMRELNPMAQMASCWSTAAAAYTVLRGDAPSSRALQRG